ncbi:MAG: Gfo/Idh/MocA family oxidoreductase [Pirellulaceae bacterium]|nr:Gfo/Idh/MocA family oxidoreductase [Pirellulaceae bacterium]
MSQRLRVAIIGLGSIGERHTRCFQATQRVDLAICDCDEALCATVQHRYSIDKVYTDVADVVRVQPDVAVIATPANLHIPMANKLAEAGIHLLIEKPLSTSLEAVDHLCNVVAQQRLVVSVAYTMRSHPSLAGMRKAIQGGAFGRPLQLVVTGGQHFPTYRPAYREIYYRDHKTGGGAIQDALTHAVNAAEWIVGPVTELAADAGHLALPGVQVEDTVHVVARHGDVMASYNLNQHQAPNESTLTVICEKASLRCEFHHQQWKWLSEPAGEWVVEKNGPFERDQLYIDQAHTYLDALEHGNPVACSISEGLQTLRVNLAILKAVKTRTWQMLPTLEKGVSHVVEYT